MLGRAYQAPSITSDERPDMSIQSYSIKAKGFKCFGEAPQGFDQIKPFNVIIGRNNSGKSSLLDLIEHLINATEISRLGHRGLSPSVIVGRTLDDDLYSQIQLPQHHQYKLEKGITASMTPRLVMRDLLGSHFIFEYQNGENKFLKFKNPEGPISNGHAGEIGRLICARHRCNFAKHTFKRILADRDLSPEPPYESDSGIPQIGIAPNGRGVTSTIQAYLDFDELDREIVEEKVLRDLNSIFIPDASFERILCEKTRNGNYEIKLREKGKGDVPLSRMGSGIKTVLTVLASLYLSAEFDGDESKWRLGVFAFEELENNLHPAVQRRLFGYLRELAARHGCTFFITTHSNAVIDQFTSDDGAQVLHVRHDGDSSTVTAISTSLGHGAVLDDLDIRASDLLQTNAAIWVEGPSDRIYLNRWIELWSDGRLKEGVHYEILLLGGNCNSHFSFGPPKERGTVDAERLISAFKINRNFAVMHDSDKQSASGSIKSVVRRLKSEAEAIGGYFWITAGRNVENYIPVEALRELAADPGVAVVACGKYEDGLEHARAVLGKKSQKKTELARSVSEVLTREMLESTSDLPKRLDALCSRIYAWNRLPVPSK